MDIKTASSEELFERRTAIAGELDAPEANLDALEAEVRAINEELETRKNNEAKKAEVRQAIANGTEPAEKIKEFKEVEKMEERTFTPDSIEYRDAYMKNLMGQPMSMEERTALTVAANVIPTETLNRIYGILEENPLINAVDVLHIPGYVSIPVATTVNDAAWTAMGTAATDSADVIGTVALTAKKLIKTIEITADVAAMSIPAFASWLANKLAQKMEKAICAAIVNGGGTTDPTGVGQCGITKYSAGLTGPTLATLSAFMGTLGSAYQGSASWVMSAKTFFNLIQPLASDVNGVLVQDGIGYRLLGHQVIFSDACDSCKFKSGSTADSANCDHIIFGDFKQYVFNFGEGIAIEADSSVAFRTGSVVYRGMALADGAPVDKDAFVWSVIAAAS
jgi:HK97 family phage major capsid protein